MSGSGTAGENSGTKPDHGAAGRRSCSRFECDRTKLWLFLERVESESLIGGSVVVSLCARRDEVCGTPRWSESRSKPDQAAPHPGSFGLATVPATRVLPGLRQLAGPV